MRRQSTGCTGGGLAERGTHPRGGPVGQRATGRAAAVQADDAAATTASGRRDRRTVAGAATKSAVGGKEAVVGRGRPSPPPPTPPPPFCAPASASSRAPSSPGSSASWSTCSGYVRARNPARKNRRRAPPAAVGGESPAVACPRGCPRLAVGYHPRQAVWPRGGPGLAPAQQTAVPPSSSPLRNPPTPLASTPHTAPVSPPQPFTPRSRGTEKSPPGSTTTAEYRTRLYQTPSASSLCAKQAGERSLLGSTWPMKPDSVAGGVSVKSRGRKPVGIATAGAHNHHQFVCKSAALPQPLRRWSCRPRCTIHVVCALLPAGPARPPHDDEAPLQPPIIAQSPGREACLNCRYRRPMQTTTRHLSLAVKPTSVEPWQ